MLAIAYDCPSIKNVFTQHQIFSNKSFNISTNMCRVTGFVLRPGFFEKKDVVKIKNFFKIPVDKPIVLIMFGAQGADSLYAFAKQLACIAIPVHIIMCVGKRHDIRKNIESIHFPAYISITILDFTDRISDLMALSDLIITKSGSVSVNEAIYMNVPIILDATGPILWWEKFNHRFIKEHDFGLSLYDLKQLPKLITQLLTDKILLAKFKKNLIAFNKENSKVEIKKCIHDLMQ